MLHCLKKTETTTALGYLMPPRKLSQKNVRKMFALCPKTSQKRGAASEIRTPDLRITSALLYP